MAKLVNSMGEYIAKVAAEAAYPIAFRHGAIALAEAMPEDWLEKILMKHHDDYGEFDYKECAKEIKRRLIKQANRFGKHPQSEAKTDE